MFDALLAFLRTNCDAKVTASPTELAEGAQSKAVVVDGNTLRIGYRAEDKTTNLYADTASGTRPDADYALVEKIGRRFNEKLKQGSHQDLFTTY